MAGMHKDTGLQIHIDSNLRRHPLLDAWDNAEKIKSNNRTKIALCNLIQFCNVRQYDGKFNRKCRN